MGLETATYISGLNSSNPVHATDQVSEGDDHLRLIKATLLSTFPNITGALTVTHTELNYLLGITGKTGFGNVVLSAGPTFTNTITCTAINASANITANAFSGSMGAANIDSGTMNNAQIAESNVTQHEGAITITKSQVSDFGFPLYSNGTSTTLSIGTTDTTLSRLSAGQLAVEGDAVFTHDNAALTSGKVFFSDGVEPTTQGANGDIFLVY